MGLTKTATFFGATLIVAAAIFISGCCCAAGEYGPRNAVTLTNTPTPIQNVNPTITPIPEPGPLCGRGTPVYELGESFSLDGLTYRILNVSEYYSSYWDKDGIKIEVNVKNTGMRQTRVSCSEMRVIDSQGREFGVAYTDLFDDGSSSGDLQPTEDATLVCFASMRLEEVSGLALQVSGGAFGSTKACGKLGIR